MLLQRATLDGIAAGEITLAFRRWKRPTVKAGGRLRTVVGELEIEAVDVLTEATLTSTDAKRAGYTSLEQLRDSLRRREGKLYRIRLRLAGPDPRVALRNQEKLTRAELEEDLRRLAKMDRRSPGGPWTQAALEAIDRSPAVRAGDLATELGQERLPFKQRVRRLKELGLTESLEVGYRLSPRGTTILRQLRRG